MSTSELIIVYSTTWCPDCRRTKQYLDRQGIPYTWIDIDKDSGAAQEVLRINGGRRSIPTLIFPDGSALVEPSNKQLGEKLGVQESQQGKEKGAAQARPVEATAYRVTGSQLFFRVPEAVCEECDLTVAVARGVRSHTRTICLKCTALGWMPYVRSSL